MCFYNFENCEKYTTASLFILEYEEVAFTATRKETVKKMCSSCGRELPLSTGFYTSKSPLFALDKKINICKDCFISNALNDETGEIDETKFKNLLRKTDFPYYRDNLQSAANQYAKEHGYVSDNEVKYHGADIVKLYMKNVNSLRQLSEKSFEDSEKDGFIQKRSAVKKNGENVSIFNDSKDGNGNKENNVKWTKEDKQNMKYAIEVIGYDPFEDYPDENRKFLFNSLSPYLEDDDNVDDAYKLSQILQIIKNNFQIDTCDKKMSQLDPLKDAESIKTLSDIKNKLVQSNDKIAKENEISVKNRSNKDAGKSTLTYLMRDLREKDFDKAEADYYDQLRSEGTRWAIEISQKAILDHCIFDENDKKEIYETQLKLIDNLNQELDDKKEEIRQLLMKIDELNATIKKIGE